MDSARCCDLINWVKLVNRIGMASRATAWVGLSTSVKSPIAAAGKPMPKNPLTMPAMNNVMDIKIRMLGV